MTFLPTLLMEKVHSLPGVDEFQVVLRRQDPADPYSMDELVLRVATTQKNRDALAAELVAATTSAVGVRPRVEFVRPNDIYDPDRQTKAERLVDWR